MTKQVSNTNTIKTVFKNISWLTLQDVILQPLGLAFFIILGRQLGDTGLGLYSYVFTIGTFFSYILDFGLTTFFWRRWSFKPEEYKNDLPWILGYRAILLIPFTLLFAGYMLVVEKSEYLLFALVYILFVLENIRSIPLYYAQATNQFSKVMLINVLDKGLVFIFSGILLLLGRDLITVLVIHAGFRFCSTLYAFYLFRQPLHIKLSLKGLITVLKPSIILLIIQMLTIVFFKIDTVMIKFFLGIGAVGLYSASYKLIESSLLIPNIVLAALFPTLMKMESTNPKQSKNMLEEIVQYLLLLGVFFAILCQLHADDFLYLIYGTDFAGSTLPMQWLGWCIPLLFINTVLIAKMLALHREKGLLYRSIILIMVNVLLNYFLLPRFFITGAAVATLICEIINFALLVRMTSAKLPFFLISKVFALSTAVLLLGNVLNLYYIAEVIIEIGLFISLVLILKLFSIKRVIKLLS